ncbi:acyl-CoA dehydrogenase [Halalkalicoccus tibetensis]|uniref:Acyl-CoA dehydrogenase n=1 Tax=Halalkalicoccus tibetensis TaxID=175632 RepID=A0ABD5VAS1_9EURY
MTNFKSGSGNLDFGGGGESEDEEEENGTDESVESRSETDESGSDDPGQSSGGPASEHAGDTGDQPERQASNRASAEEPATASAPSEEYPYFVRRSNVGDERGTRLEIHVRDEVANREGEFRSALAEQLDTNEVAKTDAREFALLAAYRNPERVAELMREEGFGALD